MTKWNLRSIGFLLALTGMVGCANPQNGAINGATMTVDGQIIGGTDATGQEDFTRSIVSLYDVAQGALCTGSILSDSIVVTAAHCVDGSKVSDLRIIYGTNLETRNIIVRGVDAYAISPLWASRQNEEFNSGDIAIVHFNGGLPAGYKPAALLTDVNQLKDGTPVLLAGYGISDGVNKTGSGRLRYVDVAIKNAAYSKTEILLDQTHGKGACHGDSGGPAYVNVNGRLLLWGVTSRGVGDENDDCSVGAAYTTIPFYIMWISRTMKELNTPRPPAQPTRPQQPAPQPQPPAQPPAAPAASRT